MLKTSPNPKNNQGDGMKWIEKVAVFGEPVTGKWYDCKIEHDGTKKVMDVVLQAVDEDDCAWRDKDGDEIDEWNWTVTEWQPQNSNLDRLAQELAEKTKVLEFYANSADLLDGYGNTDDYSLVELSKNLSAEVLGKRARQCLAKWGGK